MPKRLFMVMRTRGPSWDDEKPLEQQVEWPEHAAFMDGLAEDGFLVLVGPLEGTPDVLLVVRASSAAEIETRLNHDPWAANRLLLVTRVAPWQIRIGSLA